MSTSSNAYEIKPPAKGAGLHVARKETLKDYVPSLKIESLLSKVPQWSFVELAVDLIFNKQCLNLKEARVYVPIRTKT